MTNLLDIKILQDVRSQCKQFAAVDVVVDEEVCVGKYTIIQSCNKGQIVIQISKSFTTRIITNVVEEQQVALVVVIRAFSRLTSKPFGHLFRSPVSYVYEGHDG